MNKFLPVNKPLLTKKDINSVSNTLKSGWISSEGPGIKIFEKNFSKFIGHKYSVAVSSGTAALDIAVKSLNLKKNDEIIIPNFTIISNALAAIKLGLKIKLVDCDLKNWNMNIQSVERAISNKTKAIIATHIYNFPLRIDLLKKICKKRKIFLVEDAAQAFGTMYKNKYLGTFGELGIYSTSITKTFTSGLGGFLAVNNTNLAKKIYSMRRHGFSDIQNIKSWSKYGGNFKITDIQSAIALIQLKNIRKKFSTNISNLKYFQKKLKKYEEFIKPINIDFNKEIPVYNEFIVKNRNKFSEFLKKNDVQTRLSSPNFQNIKFLKKIVDKNGYPNSKEVENNYIYLESGPGLKKRRIDEIIKVIEKFYTKIN